MGLAVSLIIAAVGLILALAVHSTSSSVDVNTVGWILFLVGLIGFIVDLLLWSSWGPGYMRRQTAYVDAPPGRAYPARRRRVVEEVDDPAGPPPGY
jgi:Zn-dependent protease with chaperone function